MRLYLDTPAALPLLSWALTSQFHFSSSLRGGKLETEGIPLIHTAEILQTDFLAFFSFFYMLVDHGSGLTSQNDGWTCVNSNWMK